MKSRCKIMSAWHAIDCIINILSAHRDEVEEEGINMKPTTIRNMDFICKRMMEKGYTYASFQPDNYDTQFRIPSDDESKPSKGLYFSKLDEIYDEDDNLFIGPQWMEFVLRELTDQIPKIKSCNLLFAKFENTELLDFDSNDKDQYQTKNSYQSYIYKWAAIASKYHGVKASNHNDQSSQYRVPWDVDTVVVWNPSGLHDLQIFKPPPKDFIYEFNE